MVLYNGNMDLSRLPQSKYVIVLHSDLLSRVVHFDGPPFFLDALAKRFHLQKIRMWVSKRQMANNDINYCIS
jgi:hypothetical protein